MAPIAETSDHIEGEPIPSNVIELPVVQYNPLDDLDYRELENRVVESFMAAANLHRDSLEGIGGMYAARAFVRCLMTGECTMPPPSYFAGRNWVSEIGLAAQSLRGRIRSKS